MANAWRATSKCRRADAGVGLVVRASQPLVAERSTCIANAVTISAGETSVGAPHPSVDWYFAEGVTGPTFETFLLLANPTDTTADVQVTYLPDGAASVVRTHLVGAKSRVTVRLNDEAQWADHTGMGMHVHVTNDVPIMAERAMWWSTDANGSWADGHSSVGSRTTGTAFALGDGVAGGPQGASTYVEQSMYWTRRALGQRRQPASHAASLKRGARLAGGRATFRRNSMAMPSTGWKPRPMTRWEPCRVLSSV